MSLEIDQALTIALKNVIYMLFSWSIKYRKMGNYPNFLPLCSAASNMISPKKNIYKIKD